MLLPMLRKAFGYCTFMLYKISIFETRDTCATYATRTCILEFKCRYNTISFLTVFIKAYEQLGDENIDKHGPSKSVDFWVV
jgi:hypothetical protein